MFIQTMNKENHSDMNWNNIQAQLEQYEAGKYDVVSKNIRVEAQAEGGIKFIIDGVKHDISKDGRLQILRRVSPAGVSYLRQCPDELLAINLNHWLQFHTQTKNFMARCREVDGNRVLRGLVSDRFAKLDHHAIFSDIREKYEGQFNPKGLILNDNRMVLRVSHKDPIDMETIQRGDYVGAGVDISNSEIGMGKVHLKAITYRVLCKNGMVDAQAISEAGKRHIGKDHDLESFFNAASQRVGSISEELLKLTKESVKIELPKKDILNVFTFLTKQYSWNASFAEDAMVSYIDKESQELGGNKYALIQSLTETAKRYKQDDRLSLEEDAGRVLKTDMGELLKSAQDYQDALMRKQAKAK